MSAPVLSRRLQLERPDPAPDGAGGISAGWTELGRLWANVTAKAGREQRAGGHPLSSVGYNIIVRAAPYGAPDRPEAGQRFRSGARACRIIAVSEYAPDGRYLLCHAQEESAA